ncbi:hypothetical protein [Methylobacillus glycogenes]|uniref:hypothetical protein n=1 Tax=Methylobacillus glycogenes TaxID=406 RepID=UPI001F445144|nr:hypothetical protein [Methylobacillus glycogenes]
MLDKLLGQKLRNDGITLLGNAINNGADMGVQNGYALVERMPDIIATDAQAHALQLWQVGFYKQGLRVPVD